MVKTWLRRLLGDPAPAPITLTIYPYSHAVSRLDYLWAWDRVRESPEGQIIIHALHDNLVAALSERCPVECKTFEEAALWKAGHDARKKVLIDLTTHAVKGAHLAPRPNPVKPTPIKAGGTMERNHA